MAEDWIELQYSTVRKRIIRLYLIVCVKKIVAILAINIACKKKKNKIQNLDCQCNAIMPE